MLPRSFRLLVSMFVIALISLSALRCGKEETAQEPLTMEVLQKPYSPPPDGKITTEQAEAFAAAFLEFLQLDVRYSARWRSLLSPDSLYLISSDSGFAGEHPELRARFQQLLETKNRERARILSSYGLTDSEYEWIGTQLSAPGNQEMAALVVSRLKD